MIIGLGNDICNIKRIEQTLHKFGNRFIERVFSLQERQEMDKDINKIAAGVAKRFAAKEAFSKALGTGIANGIQWREIELLHRDNGQPWIKLSGKCERILQQLAPKTQILVSLSDDYPYAQAVVIIEKL